MTYQQTIDFLYSKLPAFQNLGKKAIRPDFGNILKLCEHLGNPQEKFKTIHVAGTNGKGSSSHMIAAALQANGYKTGLYTSPHLKDFRERFRINGEMPSKSFVIGFVKKHQKLLAEVKPSFFEMTVVLAFHYFALHKVDIAVIEVGLGGRLDSTNIITPEICLITNIGLDHTDVLGDSLEKIAFEKAGIIKADTPVIISEYLEETARVFDQVARDKNSPIYYARDLVEATQSKTIFLVSVFEDKSKWSINLDLKGKYQEKNVRGVMALLMQLPKLGIAMNKEKTIYGLDHTSAMTGLKGRWQKLSDRPLTICDTGHNEHAFAILREELSKWAPEKCHLILGFAQDKDLSGTLGVLPSDANYYFTSFHSPRAADVKKIDQFANIINITNKELFPDVNQALSYVRQKAKDDDFIFIGGSTYLVAEIEEL